MPNAGQGSAHALGFLVGRNNTMKVTLVQQPTRRHIFCTTRTRFRPSWSCFCLEVKTPAALVPPAEPRARRSRRTAVVVVEECPAACAPDGVPVNRGKTEGAALHCASAPCRCSRALSYTCSGVRRRSSLPRDARKHCRQTIGPRSIGPRHLEASWLEPL